MQPEGPLVPADVYVGDPLALNQAPEWTWAAFAFYLVGLILHLAWEARKWVRDNRREGKDSTVAGYFKHYNLMEVVIMISAVGFYWAWARESLSLTVMGAEFSVPYVPELSFVMGFFSDTFARHLVKMLRNMKNRLTGNPI